MSSDTVVAISTPPGRGGIGIVRLSGPHAIVIAAELLTLEPANLEHARARYTRVIDPVTGSVLDEALATAFLAPHSYTGEDIVEIATHGAPVILHAVLENALAAGNRLSLPTRLAEPGEFTQRAFANGRLDLTQAEAVHDLIAARTLDQARQAAQQLGGALSRRLAPAKAQLVYLIALLEAGMDFASGELDDVDVVPPEHIAAEVSTITASLQTLAATYARGHLLRSGAALALVGRPNAGKSSLFNRLLERERAIVTATPGTTRDTVEESLSLAGIPLRLVDTAGLRGLGPEHAPADDTPVDEAEALGIARSREALADADLVLLVHDATQTLTRGEEELLEALAHRPHLVVLNKADLTPSPTTQHGNAILTSALTGDGIPEVRAAILQLLRADTAISDTAALTTPRQLAALQSALDALAGATQANTDHLPHEALLLDLHAALTAIDSLTGQTTPDDILAVIFSTFCIGK